MQIQGVQTGNGAFTYTRGNCTLQARGGATRPASPVCTCVDAAVASPRLRGAAAVWHGKHGPFKVCSAHIVWCLSPRNSGTARTGRRGRLEVPEKPDAVPLPHRQVSARLSLTAWRCAESGRARGAGLHGATVSADRLAERAAASHALDLRPRRARQLHVHGRCAPLPVKEEAV